MYGTLISSVTVGAGGASSIDFTDIPQTPYTDLVVVLAGRLDNAGTDTPLTFNNSSSGYSMKILYGTGSSTSSASHGSQGNFTWGGHADSSSMTANTFGNTVVTIPNYAGSANKTVSIDGVSENNATTCYQIIGAGLWADTSAITSVKFTGGTGNFVQYTTAYLYGLTKGSGGATVS